MDTSFQWDDLQLAVETSMQAVDEFGYGSLKMYQVIFTKT